jgi:hypothetical protein
MLGDRIRGYVFELWYLGEVRAMGGRGLTSSLTRVHIGVIEIQGSNESRVSSLYRQLDPAI